MEIILAILFLLLCGVLYFLANYWFVLLAIIAVIGIVWLAYIANIDKAVSAEIISTEPIVKRVSEKTGYSIGYGRYLSSHEHYRYKDAVVGYKVKFRVNFNNGECRVIECKEGSTVYNKLIRKQKK